MEKYKQKSIILCIPTFRRNIGKILSEYKDPHPKTQYSLESLLAQNKQRMKKEGDLC
jgi:hypothetical protein